MKIGLSSKPLKAAKTYSVINVQHYNTVITVLILQEQKWQITLDNKSEKE